MWRDVFLNNREAVLEMLGRFNEDLSSLQRAIRWGDGDMLFNLFTRTRAIRRSIIDAGQDIGERQISAGRGQISALNTARAEPEGPNDASCAGGRGLVRDTNSVLPQRS